MSDIMRAYKTWLEKVADPQLSNELKSIADDADGISDRFYKDLDFGTAGLRGILGAGTNRMNIYTVARATQGFSDYINSVSDTPSVAIAYDSRINSGLFSKTAARVFAANGIKVYLYSELAPTPMLSFAVRHLKCDAGVVVTASHNPAEYNGYKAYGSDGCQLSVENSAKVTEKVEQVDIFTGVKYIDFDSAVEQGKIVMLGDDIFEQYYKAVIAQSVNKDIIAQSGLNIIYTPLHGAGNRPVQAVLKKVGIKSMTVVKEQEKPDGNFPTAPYPNPEIRQPYECALKLAEEIKPDLLLATDPDADRVGIAVKDGSGYKLMTGNEVGAMLLYYVLSQRKLLGTLPENPVAVKSIVSTSIARRIAEDFGCEMVDVLTGFKYIGEQIALLEEKGEEHRYVFGFEESYGYLAGGYVRDKDAVVASMLICEMTAYFKSEGKTVLDFMNEIYNKYGYYKHSQQSFTFEGGVGMEKMAQLMADFRANAPKEICGKKILSIDDFKTSKTVFADGTQKDIILPTADVIAFNFEDDVQIIVRPSGTEPKIKVYFTVKGADSDSAQQFETKISQTFKKMFDL